MNREREMLLRQIQQADFVVAETAMYLDGHPRNKKALAYYNQAVKNMKALHEKYTAVYGPIKHSDAKSENMWKWIDSPWPWQTESEV